MKRSRLFTMLAATVALVCAFALAACGGSPASDEPADSGSAAASGADNSADITELIVGFDQAYPPYGFVGDDGEFTGFDLDLAAEVAQRCGWEVTYEPIDWDAKDTLLDSGAISCIWNGFTMEGREDDYTFSEPYMLNGQVVVVKADSGIESFDDLAGKTVITQVDSAALDVLEGDQADLAATFASLEQIGEYNTAFMQLESGAVDAVACDLSIAEYQMAANPDAYAQLPDMLSEEHYAVGFKKGNQQLADKVTETLREMDEDGTIEELCNKYAEYGISYDNWVLE
ncbi:transporter substrate-binding domain-containing protein [Collinsella ihumii]|uniref:transporter substrate-binding domain-containing protein n=1 Tax=Collinsella ihumii TaxID=1720204 RepID=UPI000830AE63|nr:transporter substrate-binding domain-containing protein [Collinsella ihumii]MBM6905754.1 transporter substrate-binding domain-containing protein [Collinsella tanakaei]MCF6413187.1 transporter substrate-binding domain-containing protein [Collinsella tanakaei]